MRIPDTAIREEFLGKVGPALNRVDSKLIYLFGTFGTEYERLDSDVDLAFLAAHPTDPKAVTEAAESLSEILHREVDLIDLRRAPTSLRHVVLEEGDGLACLDPLLRDEFEMYTRSDYARLNEERRPILEAIRAESA